MLSFILRRLLLAIPTLFGVLLILNKLWGSLPRPPFTDEDTEAVADRVYDYLWQRSASGRDLRVA